MDSCLEIFGRIVGEVAGEIGKNQLHAVTGKWHGSSAIRIDKDHWREGALFAGPSEAGIFFSVWVDEESLRRKRFQYNIHALKLRSLRRYQLRSREFAAAFRDGFATHATGWPNVSTNHGPQTLMQGWGSLDELSFEREVADLVRRFVPLSSAIDTLLDARSRES